MSNQIRRIVGLTAGLAALCAGAVHAQQPGQSKVQKPEPAATQAAPSAPLTVSFTVGERRLISDYFVKHPYSVKPLPPGIAKNFARGKPLPPGIAKQRLPADLSKQLAPRTGLEVTIVGDKVVLLAASGLVADILEGIFH